MAKNVPLSAYKKAYRQISIDEAKKTFAFHLGIFVIINALLIVINIFYFPLAIWFLFPMILWGLGLFIHYVFGVYVEEKWVMEKEKKADALLKKK